MFIKTVGDFRKAVRLAHPRNWYGGYEAFFITSDGASLCYDCAVAERSQILWSIANKVRDGWKVEAADSTANYDSNNHCDHCSHNLSAYSED